MAPVSNPIVNLTRGTLACERALIADRPLRRMRGLLGRRALPADQGLLLRPAASIHTAFMQFPIDVVFLDGDFRVVKMVETLGPWRIASARRGRVTLELAAGQAAARGLCVGDRLGFVSVANQHDGDSLQDGWTPTGANNEPAALQALDGYHQGATGSGRLVVTAGLDDPTPVPLAGDDRPPRSSRGPLSTLLGAIKRRASIEQGRPDRGRA